MAKSKLYLPTLIININTFVFNINKLQEGKMLADILNCTKKCICNLTCNIAKQCEVLAVLHTQGHYLSDKLHHSSFRPFHKM